MKKWSITFCMALFVTMLGAQVPTDGLVGEYRFSNSSYEDTAGDADLSAFGSTLTGTTNRAGGANRALFLAGDYLQRTGTANFDQSVSFWVKTSTNDANKRVIVDQTERIDETEAAGYTGWYVFLQNGTVGVAGNFLWAKQVVNIVSGTVYEQTGYTGYMSTSATTSIADDDWHHIAVTVFTNEGERQNGTQIKATYKVYVDGVLEGSNDQIYTAPDHSWSKVKRFLNVNYPITIGNSKDGNSTNNYRDNFDDLRVYDKALSDAEVTSLFGETACAASTGVTISTTDVSVYLDADGNATIDPDDIDDGSVNTCGDPVSLSLDVSSFSCDDLGENTVTLTGDDGEGNQDSNTATVTVYPYLEVTEVHLSLDADGNTTLDIDDIDTTPFSDCSAITYTFGQSDFTCADLGLNDISITANFGSGLSTASSINLYIEDNDGPEIDITPVTVTLDESQTASIVTADVATVEDNCTTVPTISLSKSQFSCSDVGENTITITATDDAGNETQEEVVVTVLSGLSDIELTTSDTEVCLDGSSYTVNTDFSDSGVNYYLRNSSDNSIIDGPIAGTGSGLSFSTGELDENTTFHVLAEQEATSGTGLSFDGVDDYISFTENTRGISTQVTVSLWVKTTSANRMFLASKYDFVTGFVLYINEGKISFDGRDNSGVYKQSGASTTLINDGEWHYVSGTANISTGEWSVFVDGVLEASATNSTGSTLANSTVLYTGMHNSDSYFIGEIDQITFWNVALDASAIAANMESCFTSSETSLVGYFNLEEGSGSSTSDNSAYEVDGTLSNLEESSWVSTSSNACISSSCSFVLGNEVTIGDQTNPTAIAQNIEVTLDENGEATITADEVDNGSTDNCTAQESLELTLDISSFTTNDVGQNDVILTVTDEAGNSSTATATITVIQKFSQVITFTAINDQTYGVAPIELDATTNADGLDVTLTVLSGPGTLDGNSLSITGVGTVTVEATQTGNDTYFAASSVQQTFEVLPASLTVTANDIEQVYNGTVPEFSYTIEGFVNSENEEVLLTAPSITSDATANVGSYTLTPSGANADNYTITHESGTLSISAAPLDVTADNHTINYGEDVPELTYAFSGFVNSEDQSVLGVLPEISVDTDGSAGTYDIILSTGESKTETANNYDLNLINGTLTIQKLLLTVAADNQEIVFGDEIPGLTISYSGFATDEDQSNLSAIPVASTSASSSSDAGTYEIAVGGGVSGNYDFSYVTGSLSILKATATIELSDLNQEMTGLAIVPTVSTDPAGLNFTLTYDGNAEAPSGVGSYEVVATIEETNFEGFTTGILVIAEPVLTNSIRSTQLTFYPNPVESVIHISGEVEEIGQVNILNMNGQKVKTVQLTGSINQIEVDTLTQGMYMLQILDRNNRIIELKKVIKR